MLMNTNIFVIFCLSVTLGFTYFYAQVREHFSPKDHYAAKIKKLEDVVERERLKHLLTSYEFADFRAHVGTLLPEAIKNKGPGEKSYPLRSLASVVQKSENANLNISRALNLYEESKKLFREKKYSLATQSLKLLIQKHPYSAYIPEAMFLVVESEFVLRNYDECVAYTNRMLDLFPEFELTGYALVRLGKVYEMQERHQEAIEVYQTVLKSFPQRDVANVAQGSLKAIQL